MRGKAGSTLQQLETAVRRLVALREHGGAGLHEDVELGVLGGFFGNSDNADAGNGRGEILEFHLQGGGREFEAGLGGDSLVAERVSGSPSIR